MNCKRDVYQLNFKANFIKNVPIQKRVSAEKFVPSQVSLVELDINNQNDIEALGKTAVLWERKASTFANYIYIDATKDKQYPDVEKEHYYALTKQNENFELLNPNSVLALAVYAEKKDPMNEIMWLQVDPKTNTKNASIFNREYKNIGTAIVDFLKSLSQKPLYVQSDTKATPFYEKQGFESMDLKHPDIMCWQG